MEEWLIENMKGILLFLATAFLVYGLNDLTCRLDRYPTCQYDYERRKKVIREKVDKWIGRK